MAFIYPGPVGDAGWSWAQDQGRQAIEKSLPGTRTAYLERVPENSAAAERALRDFARKGYKLIIAASFGYTEPILKVARDFPDTVFIHVSGYKTAPNVGTVFGKIEEPRYVSGMVAGKMTRSHLVGYVAAFPIPEVIRGINAFALGLRKTDPRAVVKVAWTHTWLDLQKERQAAEALLAEGADVITQHQDTPGPVQAAQAAGKYAVGYHADMSRFAPRAVLTSAVWNWGACYVPLARQVRAGTWKSERYWGGWREGVVDLAPLGPMVPPEVRRMVEGEVKSFKAGQQSLFTIFTGPLKDQKGRVRVPAGQAMTVEEIEKMDWLVEGVVASLPPPTQSP